jgi:hypothetical protein
MRDPSGLTEISPEPPSAAAARLAIERTAGFLKVARVLIEDGRRIDLSGFEADAGRLCAEVLDLTAASGRALVPQLSALLVEIDAIEAKLARAGPSCPEK